MTIFCPVYRPAERQAPSMLGGVVLDYPILEPLLFSWYNQLGSMGEPSLDSGPLVVSCLEELPDSQSRIPDSPRAGTGAGQGRPTKQEVGAGRQKPRPDYNRNRKHSHLRSSGAQARGEPVG